MRRRMLGLGLVRVRVSRIWLSIWIQQRLQLIQLPVLGIVVPRLDGDRVIRWKPKTYGVLSTIATFAQISPQNIQVRYNPSTVAHASRYNRCWMLVRRGSILSSKVSA